MAQMTRAEFDAYFAGLIEDNTTNSITPEDLRNVFNNFTDSVVWYNESTGGGEGGGGDVVGPVSATDGYVAQWDGTTGALLKNGLGIPVVSPGTVTDGRAVLFSGTTGAALAQASGPPVLGPGTVTSGRAVLFSGTSGNAISAAAGPPVLGPGTVTDGRAVVFSGTSGDLLAQAAGAPVLGPGAVTSGHAALFSGASGDLLSSAGAAPTLATAASFAGVSTTTAADGTHGPTLGAAVKDAVTSMSAANVLDLYSDWGVKAGYTTFVIDPALTLATGDLPIIGPAVATNVRSLTNVSLTAVEQEGDCFFTTAPVASGAGGQYSTFLQAWQKIQEGRPYTAAEETTLSSNIIQFDCTDGGSRHVKTPSALTANSTVAAASWAGILDGEEPVVLRVTTGATGRTLVFTTTADGMVHLYDNTVILTASSYTYFRMWRFDGVPHVERLTSTLISGAGSPDPEFIAHAVAVDNPTSATIPAHSAGDLEVYYAHFGGGSALPAIPGALADFPIDTDAPTQPAMRVASRTAATTEASPTTLAGFTGCSSIHCLIFRLATGTPRIHATSVFASTAAADTTPTFGSLDAGINAIYLMLSGLQSTDTMTMPAGTTTLTAGSSGGGVYNNNYVSYTPVTATPGWVSADGTKTGTVGRCNAAVIAITV